MASAAIQRTCGIETIPHLTRDLTVMGLSPRCRRARRGLRDILAVAGNPPEVDDYPGLARASTRSTPIGLTG